MPQNQQQEELLPPKGPLHTNAGCLGTVQSKRLGTMLDIVLHPLDSYTLGDGPAGGTALCYIDTEKRQETTLDRELLMSHLVPAAAPPPLERQTQMTAAPCLRGPQTGPAPPLQSRRPAASTHRYSSEVASWPLL